MRRTARHIPFLLASAAAAALVSASSCKREERGFRVDAPAAETTDKVVMSDLRPGSLQVTATQPAATQSYAGPNVSPAIGLAPAAEPSPGAVHNGYEENAYALTEGQRLYNAFNCVGCHFHGGGGIGPPLMDDTWIYGGNPEQIFSTIVQGRPNGMPSFRGKIVDYQVWQIVAYVRSLSGNASQQAASGRPDHMKGPPPPNSTTRESPKQSFLPKSAEMPG
jgi:cytochrome c oxidase cbb3-type subunit 3